MKVVQLLPALNSGGVERGTLDLARALTEAGHASIVISNGGRLVEQLEREGSQHIALPIHKKSLSSLRQVRPLRAQIQALQPDILHVRSRMPAWLTYLAWKKLPRDARPRLVSTAHGLYSINRYSAIMARAERVIAISECVRDYLNDNYAHYLQSPPELIYRGVNTAEFHRDLSLPAGWRCQVENEFPTLKGKRWLLLPGRLTRWKGHQTFLELIAQLVKKEADLQGVIVGGAEPNKEHYAGELMAKARELGIASRVTFTGQRSDICYWYRASELVFNLSQRPEPFGRTVIEAVAIGTPVIGYNLGGPAESLRACFPQGLVEFDQPEQLLKTTLTLLNSEDKPRLPVSFTLEAQVQSTLSLYQSLINSG
ncbi:glycosyltransferase [Microbulbifer agarilyticus]|uniref:glycosyltransferase n=1 Tax=Microbulbifer agarilyticus TaxID=260552 RepID=UPI001CD50560|nr:glycosyltransferase family 4 protein [Microbulbifer agarilyticus]MCA0899607.1 glycosyltransferase family 4 protein [Microbulbifer agarilyticus]